uniref:Uncharacterized protein n=1 Tax=Ditylenchus dipsaci TaxID=166011 RepID=A0A915EN93_9BILA
MDSENENKVDVFGNSNDEESASEGESHQEQRPNEDDPLFPENRQENQAHNERRQVLCKVVEGLILVLSAVKEVDSSCSTQLYQESVIDVMDETRNMTSMEVLYYCRKPFCAKMKTSSAKPTASEITASETTASEITASETTATEITACQITASETTATEITACQITASETTASEITASEITASETSSALIKLPIEVLCDVAAFNSRLDCLKIIFVFG